MDFEQQVVKVEETYSIDEIYEKVKDYDLVFTAEASLADALNNRLEEPIIGHFATTPMLYVLSDYQNKKLAKERELFIETIKNTDLSWKKASYLVENLVKCWKEEGQPEAILEYDKFSEEELRKILEIVESTDNIYSRMNEAQIEGKEIAVINEKQFNQLDKSLLPDDYDIIEIFTDSQTKLQDFKLYNSTTEIINALKRNITEEKADDIAIVANPDSKYTVLAKTALREKGVPYLTQEKFGDKDDLRTFISFLNLGLSKERLLVKDCRPIIRALGVEISRKRDNDYLESVNGELDRFKDIIGKVQGSRLGYVLDQFESLNGDMEEIREALKEVGLLSQEVNREIIGKLEYYLDSYEVDSESKGEGVLFVSPRSQAYIDKPIVFYIGMDSSWTAEVREDPWIDKDLEEEKNVKNFKSLIQSGEQQHYLVKNLEQNREITPCLYLNEIVEGEFENFKDLENTFYGCDSESTGEGFELDENNVEVEKVETISKSSLDKFVQSPKQYFFSRVVDEPRQDYFIKGRLFHDFAEFYVNHQDFVKKRGLGQFIGQITGELDLVTDSIKQELVEKEIRIGLQNIMRFIDKREIEDVDLKGLEKMDSDNRFAKVFGKPIDSEITEARFENKELGINGVIDLIISENRLADHKSGRKKPASHVVRNSNLELAGFEPNFQALMYLTQLRSIKPGEKLEFSFYHFLDNSDEVVDGDHDHEENIVTITYYPEKFEHQLEKRETFDYLISGVKESNDRRKTLNERDSEYQDYREFFSDRSLPEEFDKDELTDSEFLTELIDYYKSIIGDHKYVEDGCESLLKKLVEFRRENYFKEDLDAFENFVPEQLENLNHYRKEGFPVENPFYDEELDLDKIDNRDLIMR